MKYSPHKYQEYATDFILEHPVSAVFLDMGLGKSIITLTALFDLCLDSFLVRKVLVIAPLRVARDTWPAEIKKWDHLNGLSYSVAVGSEAERKSALMQRASVYIINRENVQWLIEESGLTFDYDMVVIDELSSFKSYQAKRFRSLLKVRPFVKRIVGLTGTPSSNGLMDLWAEFRISDSCFLLGAYTSFYQYIRGVVPGTYTVSIRAKKTSAMSAYFYVTYNGNKTKYLFNKSTTFDWTDYSVTITDITDPTLRIYCYNRDASLYVSDIMLSEGSLPRKWTPAPNEIYTSEVKIDKRGIEVSNNASSQRTVITNTEFAGYYNDEVIFTLNKDETQTKKTTVDGELTVGKTKFVPMPTASDGLNIVILD